MTTEGTQTMYQQALHLQIIAAWNQSQKLVEYLASPLCQVTDSLVAARPFEAEASAAIPEATEPA